MFPEASPYWQCRDRWLDLRSVAVMGIVNVTPDSFSDGGRFLDPERAVAHGLQLIADGADILDIGGESTRPGAEPVPADVELRRVLPVVERLRQTNVLLSIDTAKAVVARAALEAGAHIVNDVTALRGDPEMAHVAADFGAGVVLMHMQGTPRTMQANPTYRDVVAEIGGFFAERRQAARAAGIADECMVFDPGIGFGKTLEHNLAILRRLGELLSLGRPVLVGPSRKSFIGKVLDVPVEDRLEGTAAAVAIAVWNGAAIVRVHDVRAMKRVAQMAAAIRGSL
ncbi:MAG: dihydropteroate synthase [Candidatus Sumerlaeia bacterium]|nr:dihydropteroate synthase [Candidatus Sumerlaeia bacterium]